MNPILPIVTLLVALVFTYFAEKVETRKDKLVIFTLALLFFSTVTVIAIYDFKEDMDFYEEQERFIEDQQRWIDQIKDLQIENQRRLEIWNDVYSELNKSGVASIE